MPDDNPEKQEPKPLLSKDGSREKSNANLQQFKPGQSGNPAGRPRKGLAELDRLNERYAGKLPEDRSFMPKGWRDALDVADHLWPDKQRTFQDLSDAVRLMRSLTDEVTAKNLDERRFGKIVAGMSDRPDRDAERENPGIGSKVSFVDLLKGGGQVTNVLSAVEAEAGEQTSEQPSQ